jgi:hypothetical protein
MLGWIAKSSRQMWTASAFISHIYGIWQSLLSKITANPTDPVKI